MPLAPGTRLGPYEITGAIGGGGMGEVYRARDPRIGRDVAIKVLPPSFASDAERLRRFEQESRAVGQLNHPNVLTIHDTGTADVPPVGPVHFIVTELLQGRTVREELRRAVPPRTALGYAIQIARGIAAAHARGIVHRDIKPENLFVSADGGIKILDFGIAKRSPPGEPADGTDAAPTATGTGLAMGTLEYMSPEQARREPVDHRTDLFAFGVVFYEMLAGVRPFTGRTPADAVSAVLRDEPPPLPDRVRDEMPSVEPLIRRCLEKEPARRIQSAEDLVFHLETLTAPHPAVTGRRAREPAGRRRIFAVAIVAAAVFGLAAAWMVLSPDAPAAPEAGPAAAARVTPFLASEAIEAHPAWSPSGNLIAYVSDAAGNDDLWICDPSGSNPINLTTGHPGVDSMPAWSPDSQRVAFFSDRGGGGIYTMNALGGDVRKATAVKPGVLYTFSLTWGKDGALYFTNFDEEGGKHVYRTLPDGRAASCLTCDQPGARAGELSPSGALLLFESSETGARGDVMVLNLASRRITRVVDQADVPRWSPDGSRVLFISARDGTQDLWQIAVDVATGAPAGPPERLTSGLGVDAFAASPDGRQILVAAAKTQASLWSFPGAAPRISSLTEGERWTAGQFVDGRARWLPGGAGAVFQSNRRGSLDVWMLPSPGAALVRLTTAAGTEHRPRPSPDGQWIAVDVIDAGGEYVHLMRRDGSHLRLPDDGWRRRFRMTCCADWSPDGTRLAMHVNAATSAIVRIDPATGAALETTELDLPGGADEYHRWSPGGQFVAYESHTRGSWDLWVVKPDGSSPHRLTSLAGNERAAAWHPRLPFVYFHTSEGAIWRVPIDGDGKPTGAPEIWMQLAGRTRVAFDSLDFSPTGDRALVALQERGSDLWLVER